MEDGRRTLRLLRLGLSRVRRGRLGDGVGACLRSCVAGVLLLLLRGCVSLRWVSCSGSSGCIGCVRVRLRLLLSWLAVGGGRVAWTGLRLLGVGRRSRVVGVGRGSHSLSDGLHHTKLSASISDLAAGERTHLSVAISRILRMRRRLLCSRRWCRHLSVRRVVVGRRCLVRVGS
mgnify:FL=1